MTSFHDSTAFPVADRLPDYHDPWGEYHSEKDGMLTPVRHWCFLGQILDVNTFMRPRVTVAPWPNPGGGEINFKNPSHTITVHFHHERSTIPTTFAWKDLKPGRTIAILYAKRKRMMDGSTGIRQEHLDSVFVFRASLSMLVRFGEMLMSTPSKSCFHAECSEQNKRLMK